MSKLYMNIRSDLVNAGSKAKTNRKPSAKDQQTGPNPPENNEVNLKKPFIVLRKYQDKMVSSNARKLWKETGVNRNIDKYLEEQLKEMYERYSEHLTAVSRRNLRRLSVTSSSLASTRTDSETDCCWNMRRCTEGTITATLLRLRVS